MLTPTEMQKLLDQINNRFSYLDNRINQLEEKLKLLDKPSPKPRTKASEKVAESA